MSVLGWILFGLLVGLVARLVTPGPNPHGFVATIVLGILGGLVGGWIGRAAGWYGPGDPVGFVLAVVGAIILLVLYHMFSRRAVS